jgi:hypothetical protein
MVNKQDKIKLETKIKNVLPARRATNFDSKDI